MSNLKQVKKLIKSLSYEEWRELDSFVYELITKYEMDNKIGIYKVLQRSENDRKNGVKNISWEELQKQLKLKD